MFEWDEQKRLANLVKHGVDFERAKLIFDGMTIDIPDARHDYGEQRIGVYGEFGEEVFFVVYTWRGENRRLISARKAGTNEREKYYALIAARNAADE
jgi:uncharacterized DUF497 family protein